MLLILIWSVVALAALYLYFRQLYSSLRQRGLKHFTPVPLLGNMAGMTLRYEHFSDYLKRLYDSFPEERLVGNFEFTNPLVVIRDLELVKKVTIKDFEHFLDHRTVVDDKLDPFWGRNLFSLKGDEWRNMRATLSPAFTSSKIRLMIPFMVEVGNQMISSLKKQIQESGTSSIEVEAKDLTSRFANDVIASCAFGLKVDSQAQQDNEFYEMGKEASTFKFRQLLVFFGYNSFPKLMSKLKITVFSYRTMVFFRSLISGTMREREDKNIVRPDMIHLLLEAKKGKLTHDDKVKDTDAGFATVEESAVGKAKPKVDWSQDDLIAQTMVFLIGGFETVSSSMAFALHELAINPDIQERLVKEIKEYNAKNGGKLDFNDLQKMPYMDMVVSELMRMWGPGFMVDRICIKDYNLGKPNKNSTEDYIIRRGEGLVIPVWALHRSPEFYPEPDKFDPERFSDENKNNIKSFTYLPFGIGPRNCIGILLHYN
uniref:unspecific monooxygenase n=1 Tax=Ostrinia furnacalis TaxID=93504 RepID=A0A7S9GLA5_OSTFU|nr:cytochrome P450 monooxygenase CYP9A151 [Ostrinia furnacalis]